MNLVIFIPIYKASPYPTSSTYYAHNGGLTFGEY